jgi:hypothetical protein
MAKSVHVLNPITEPLRSRYPPLPPIRRLDIRQSTWSSLCTPPMGPTGLCILKPLANHLVGVAFRRYTDRILDLMDFMGERSLFVGRAGI